jgi:nucleotide-binding universal stress UspA family protein
MSIRHILVPITGDEDSRPLPHHALHLAQHLSAHVTACDLTAPPERHLIKTSVGAVGLGYAAIYQGLKNLQNEQKAKARSFFDEALAARPAATTACWVDSASAEAGDPFTAVGLLSDLIIIGKAAGSGSIETAALEQALLTLQRPVLIPAGEPRAYSSAAIAWNGSAQAATAAQRAVDMLAPGAAIIVLQAGEMREGHTPPDLLLDYLSYHGFKAELQLVGDARRKTGPILLAEAKAAGADVLILGAYARSPVREMIWGGVTSFMLTQADIPIFMAH